uniref:Prolyl endopeptidase n=1 Tax=Parastrongyloides trichosuri TaxID=131310 RepID=A0A0N4ZK54_PARTI
MKYTLPLLIIVSISISYQKDYTRREINVSVYPLARRDTTIVDKIHGITIADPYRYLENGNCNETKDFVDKLNGVSKKYLSHIKVIDVIKKKMNNYENYEKYGLFEKHGNYYYYMHNTGLQNQFVLKRRRKIEDSGEDFLNINLIDSKGTISLSEYYFSQDGKVMAYFLSENESDWKVIKFKNSKNETLKDFIDNVIHSNGLFIFNNTGFIYASYPDSKEGKEKNSNYFYHSLYYHKMGTDQKDDVLIADYRLNKYTTVSGQVSSDGRYLIVYFHEGDNNMIYYCDLKYIDNTMITGKFEFTPLFAKADSLYIVIDVYDGEFIILTNKNAPMKKIIKINIEKLKRGIKHINSLIKHSQMKLINEVKTIGKNNILINYTENMKHSLCLYKKHTGNLINCMNLDNKVINTISGNKENNEFFISLSNQLTPTSILKGNIDMFKNRNNTKYLDVIVNTNLTWFNENDYETKRVSFKNKDRNRVSLVMYYKKNIKFDGSNPTLLKGYNNLKYSSNFQFSTQIAIFIKHFNGIYCFAHIRGDKAYGEKWHTDGILHKKQNSFNDFIGAAEYLIKNNYTNPSKLSTTGGLLTAVVTQQRPDIFKAVIIKASVFDLLRCHTLSGGAFCLNEYGNPDKKEDFEHIIRYSPYHNVKITERSIQWPSTFLIATKNDNNVVVAQTLKYAAKLYHKFQKAKDFQKNPVIVKIEKFTTYKTSRLRTIEEVSNELGFLKENLNLNLLN